LIILLAWSRGRSPEGGCTYFKLGETLSQRYQRDGLRDCPDARREISPPDLLPANQARAVARGDFRQVVRPAEGLTRWLADERREFKRRGCYVLPPS